MLPNLAGQPVPWTTCGNGKYMAPEREDGDVETWNQVEGYGMSSGDGRLA